MTVVLRDDIEWTRKESSRIISKTFAPDGMPQLYGHLYLSQKNNTWIVRLYEGNQAKWRVGNVDHLGLAKFLNFLDVDFTVVMDRPGLAYFSQWVKPHFTDIEVKVVLGYPG